MIIEKFNMRIVTYIGNIYGALSVTMVTAVTEKLIAGPSGSAYSHMLPSGVA